MAEFREFSAKTVADAVALAKQTLQISDDKLEYEVKDEGKSGILGIGARPAVIAARKIVTELDLAVEFLENVLKEMELQAEVRAAYAEDGSMEVEIVGDDMGVLIGKRGQTLDSLQYLVSLVVNKNREDYIRVKLDTENYRARRKETLENLAKNVASRVKRTRRTVALEPMNPYERRIIHTALQDDRYVYTQSEGEDPYRHIVVKLKDNVKFENSYSSRRRYDSGNRRQGGYRKKYNNYD